MRGLATPGFVELLNKVRAVAPDVLRIAIREGLTTTDEGVQRQGGLLMVGMWNHHQEEWILYEESIGRPAGGKAKKAADERIDALMGDKDQRLSDDIIMAFASGTKVSDQVLGEALVLTVGVLLDVFDINRVEQAVAASGNDRFHRLLEVCSREIGV